MGLRNVLNALFLLLFVAFNANATDWYVKNGGSDSGAGTSGDPFETISKVQSMVAAGDTVYFDNASTWSASSGTAVLVPEAGVTYDGKTWGSGTRAKLNATSSSISRAVVYFDDDHATYETAVIGFECDGNQYQMDGISILHNGSEFSDMTGAIKRIEDNYIHDVSDTGGWYGYGIIIAPNSTNEDVHNVVVKDNLLRNFGRSAINIYPYSECPTCTVEEVEVTGNDIDDCDEDQSAAGHGILLKNGIDEVVTECNIIRDTGSTGHSIAIEEMCSPDCDPTNLTVRYNIMIDSVYIQNGVPTGTFTISDNDVYTPPAEPPDFDSYCTGGGGEDPPGGNEEMTGVSIN